MGGQSDAAARQCIPQTLNSQSVETSRDLEKVRCIDSATLHLSFPLTVGFANSTERHSWDEKTSISLESERIFNASK